MEKEHGQIKFTETDDGFRIEVTGKSLKEAVSCCCLPMFGAFTETDDGFRIEVTGKSLKEAVSCCCLPMFGARGWSKSEGCPPGEESKSDCCPPGEEKK